MIYIQQVASVNHKTPKDVDVKACCKKVAAKFVRRTDRFIQLGILGVAQIADKQSINKNTALYLTSGQGNLAVFKRMRDHQRIENSPPKPVDFINSLSNTAGFYIAQFLGVNSKNNNIYHHGFVVEIALILAQCDLRLDKEKQILVGGVDQFFEPVEIAKQYLGVKPDVSLGEGSNWMLLNNKKETALAALNAIPETLNIDQVTEYIALQPASTQLAFALRMPKSDINGLLLKGNKKRFCYENNVGFYETLVLYALNLFVQTNTGKLIFVDYFEGVYRLLELDVFKR